jgi:acylphosphatase
MAWHSVTDDNKTRAMRLYKCLHIRIEGRVQGVGFRVFVQRQALARGLHGMVRNRRDGGVETFAFGHASACDAFTAALAHGPRGAHVAMIRVFDCDDDTTWRAMRTFEIGTTV